MRKSVHWTMNLCIYWSVILNLYNLTDMCINFVCTYVYTNELLIFLQQFLAWSSCPLSNTASSAAPQIPLRLRMLEPRIVATLALAVRRYNNSARSHKNYRSIFAAKKIMHKAPYAQ
jgi:hypothetical protein